MASKIILYLGVNLTMEAKKLLEEMQEDLSKWKSHPVSMG